MKSVTITKGGSLTRAAATGSGNQSVTGLGGKPIYIQFFAVDDGDTSVTSSGTDNSINHNCLRFSTTIFNFQSGNAVHIQTSLGNGYSGLVSSMDADGFTFAWTVIGSGRAVTVNYIAIIV